MFAAFLVRVWAIGAGIPFAVDSAEAAIAQRILRILNSGDWNPGAFESPTLVLYAHTALALLRFVLGAARAEWASLADFDVEAVHLAGRVLTAVLGTLTVWLTFHVGREAGSGRIGLIAAAQLALLPLHVRESHLMTAAVPLTLLTTLTLYLSLRHDRVGARWTGVAAGLAAGASYSGAIAIVPVMAAFLATRETLPRRLRACAIALGAAAAAFVLTTPYGLFDLPAFLESLARHLAQLAAVRAATAVDVAAHTALLALAGPAWLPMAAAGLVTVGFALTRRAGRVRWIPCGAFVLAYAAMAVQYPPASARPLLPLTPIVCLLAAAGIDGLSRAIAAVPAWRRPLPRLLLPVGLAVLLLAVLGSRMAREQREFERRDTRQVTAEWLRASVPQGARVAVEQTGPAHLATAGFVVTEVAALADHPVDWYAQQRIQYLVVSSDAARGRGYGDAGVKLIDVPPLPQRPGPAIRVVRLAVD